jgi:LacI family transcriptional regulator, galactose operon repressor
VADVARYAGVSPAVVSYVINDGPRRVAPETADRVRNAIDVLGYRPNSSARALRTGTTGMLGLVLPGTSNSFFGEYADVIYDAAANNGFALLTASSAGNVRTEHRLIEDLAGRNVDGILVATMMTKADVSSLRHPGLPIVLINCPFAVPGYRTLGPDAVAGARAVVDHLLSVHGHHSVAFITGETGVHEPEAARLDGATPCDHTVDPTACCYARTSRVRWIRSCATCAGRVRPPDRHVRQF